MKALSIIYVVVAAAVFLIAGYLTYGKFLAKKVFQLNDKKVTPAVALNDGLDYVPAKKGLLIGQHFSAIAAAGPINGPILAGLAFGWVPALVWVLLGSVFIGGVHDMGCLVASIRHQAKSITEVVRINVSRRLWILFMLFAWFALVYLIIAFTDITAGSFVGLVTLESGEQVSGGAIASSSLMYLILPIIMGLLMKYAKLKSGLALAVFLPLVGLSIWAGQYLPISLPIVDQALAQKVWGVLILAYCLAASVLPMWLLLQPRGSLGGCFLYVTLITAAIGLLFGGFTVQYPAFMNLSVDGGVGKSFWFPMFPQLFITIACGACSGFHAMVSSGTTSKQLAKESDAKAVGYGSMLLEAMVAVVSIACVMIIPANSLMAAKAPNFIYASGIGRFAELIGVSATFGVSIGLMAFTTFVYDTLDVCTRLGRYIFEELTGMKRWGGKLIGTALTAGIPVFFIFQTMTDDSGAVVPAWKIFWNTFGMSNQLLAALALAGIGVWLLSTRPNTKVWLVAFIPALLMFAMSNWALGRTVYYGWLLGQGHPAVTAVSLILLIMSLLVVIEAVHFARHRRKQPAASAASR